LRYVAKGNRIDREEVRAQLQKFQHAKVDRPAVPPYVTRRRERDPERREKERWIERKGEREREREKGERMGKKKEKGKGGEGRKNMRVTFSFRTTTKAPFPLLSPTNRPRLPTATREATVLLNAM